MELGPPSIGVTNQRFGREKKTQEIWNQVQLYLYSTRHTSIKAINLNLSSRVADLPVGKSRME